MFQLSMEENALIFANRAHKNQLRKYTLIPYITHPVEVAYIVSKYITDPDVIAAAYLHDVVEDTDFSIDFIKEFFGDKIAILVDMLTDKSKKEDGNRKARKQIDLEHTRNICSEAKSIKLADIISNSVSIIQHDLNFATVYIPEMIRLIEVLKEGHFGLYIQAEDIIVNYSALTDRASNFNGNCKAQ